MRYRRFLCKVNSHIENMENRRGLKGVSETLNTSYEHTVPIIHNELDRRR
jgi:hypothetical protein